MLKCHLKHSRNLPSELDLPGVDVPIKVHDPLADPRLELQDTRQRRPILIFLGNLGMRLEGKWG